MFAQVYTLSGAPAGAEIQINATVAGNQSQPTVVGVDGGGFMVAWSDDGGLDGSSTGVFARFFDGTGGALKSINPATEEVLAEIAEASAARGWPFPWAFATPATLDFLDALQALLLDRERRLPLPASFLVDAAGAVRVLYLGPVTAERVLALMVCCLRVP